MSKYPTGYKVPHGSPLINALLSSTSKYTVWSTRLMTYSIDRQIEALSVELTAPGKLTCPI
jgi:hypothetical protein